MEKELRRKIVIARRTENLTTFDLAERFDVSIQDVIRILKNWRENPSPIKQRSARTLEKVHVYLMETPTGNLHYSKIGISNDPDARRKAIEYGARGEMKWEVKATFLFATRREAYGMEQLLHEINAEHNVAGEYFRVPTDQLNLEPLEAASL